MAGLQRNKGKVRMFQRLIGFGNWLASIPNRVTPPPFRLIQMGSAFWQSRALYVATRVGVADALGDGRRSSAQLAESLGLHEDALYRLLRMLSSLGVFAEVEPRVFANSKLSQHLRADHPQSVRAMILMHNSPEMTRPWTEHLEDAVRTGEVPFAKTHGEELYAYMDSHPDFDRLFSEAMDAVEALTGVDYLQDFDWGRFERVIDVGGSLGSKSVAILASNPHLRALVFDRPQVVEGAAAHWQGQVAPEVLGRMEFAGGDMFEAIPLAASERDLYLMMGVFHGLDDEESGRVLARLKTAMGDHRATAVVVDMVAEQPGIDPSVAAFDMQMLMGTRGRERTRDEWTALFAGHGFGIREIVDVRTFAKFIVIQRTD
jgi:DNA-binding Lrp family transcriptional regulator